jgi:hypothetical protein
MGSRKCSYGRPPVVTSNIGLTTSAFGLGENLVRRPPLPSLMSPPRSLVAHRQRHARAGLNPGKGGRAHCP